MSVELPSDNWWVFRDHPVEYAAATDEGLQRGYGFPPIDGDTPSVLLDLGQFRCDIIPLRLPGVNSPETRGTTGEEAELAEKALNRTSELTKGRSVLVEGSDETSFNRGVADVYVLQGLLPSATRSSVTVRYSLGGHQWASLGDVLLVEDLAEPYNHD